MTRETKIGLLVGLAFVIVIGILLSDHIQSSTQPPQAVLAQVTTKLDEAVKTPGQAPSPVVKIESPGATAPEHVVPTHNDIQPPKKVADVITIGPSTAPPTETITPPDATVSVPKPAPPVETIIDTSAFGETAGADKPNLSHTPDPNDALQTKAREVGVELVNVDPRGPATPPAGAPKTYVALPGDSVSKMAARFMGGNTKANREAIQNANPALKADPNKVIAGKTYVIPAAPAVTVSAPPASVVPVAPVALKPTSPAAPGESWYTVKAGDNLWKIAKEQMGAGSAASAIRELNKNVLRGADKDVVVEGMKLRLPARSVATAN